MSKNNTDKLGNITAKDFMIIDHPIGGSRPIAEAFIIKKKFVFADIGWYDPTGHSGHPFHVVEGKIKLVGENTWAVGDAVVRPADELKDDVLGLSRWLHYIENDEIAKTRATREICLENILSGRLV